MPEKKIDAVISFYRKNYQSFVGYVRSLIADNSARDGEDIVQDVFFNLLNKADIMEPIVNVSSYIYRSLRNRVIDELRRSDKDTVSFETEAYPDSGISLADILKDNRDNPTEAMEKEELYNRMYEALNMLSSEQRNVIIATEFECYSFRELSEAWDVPVGTLLARKSRGIKLIKAYLSS